MKKITLCLTLCMFLSLVTFAQEPFYDFEVTYIGPDGTDELYEITGIATDAAPPGYFVQDFSIVVGWPELEFDTPVLMTGSGAPYGDTNDYGGNLLTADVVNTNFTPATPSTKDIYFITYADPGGLLFPISNSSGSFPIVRFKVNRAGAPGPVPAILSNTDVNVTNIPGANGVINTFVTDTDGTGPNASTDRYQEETLSLVDIQFNNIGFKAFPVPSNDVVNIHNPTSNELQYSILNLLGQTVGINGSLRANGNTQLNLGKLEGAIYFVTISNGTSKKSLKIIIK